MKDAGTVALKTMENLCMHAECRHNGSLDVAELDGCPPNKNLGQYVCNGQARTLNTEQNPDHVTQILTLDQMSNCHGTRQNIYYVWGST